jgi:hypothetical protein
VGVVPMSARYVVIDLGDSTSVDGLANALIAAMCYSGDDDDDAAREYEIRAHLRRALMAVAEADR